MERIEVNVQTGERKVVQLTAEELADAARRKAEEDAMVAARPPTPSERLAKLEAWAVSMGYKP